MRRLGFMFNNINDNNFYNTQLENQSKIVNLALMRANANKHSLENNNPYVDKTEISSSAIELFQKDCDIRKFNKIAMSDSDNLSHLDIVKELFADGVIDPYEDDILKELLDNTKLLDDLDL